MDFQELVNKMLCYEEVNRIDIEGIKNSQWYQGDKMSLNEVQKEMRNKKDKVLNH